MEIKIDREEEREAQVGDVVVVNRSVYFLMKNSFGKRPNTFSAMGFTGGYANGEHNSIEALLQNLSEFGKVEIYSSKDYELKLVKKEGSR